MAFRVGIIAGIGLCYWRIGQNVVYLRVLTIGLALVVGYDIGRSKVQSYGDILVYLALNL